MSSLIGSIALVSPYRLYANDVNDRDFALEESLGFLVNRLGRELGQQLATRLRLFGVTVPQWVLMQKLFETPGLTQQELVRQTGVDQATLSGTLNRLGGRIRREPDPSDGRVQRVFLAEGQEGLLREGQLAARQVNQLALTAVSAEDQVALKRALTAALAALSGTK